MVLEKLTDAGVLKPCLDPAPFQNNILIIPKSKGKMTKSEKFKQKLRSYAEDNMNLTASSDRQGGYTQ